MSGTISDDDFGFGGSSQGTESNYLAALGRISGKALADNLERNGINLTFRNGSGDPDLLFLDVTNKRIGVNREDPSLTLEIIGTSKVTENVNVNGTSAKISNIIFGTNGTVSTQVGPINIIPAGSDPYIQYGKVLTDDLEINNNYIRANITNQPIEMFAHGTGIVDIGSSTTVTGNLQVVRISELEPLLSGNIQVNGNVQFNGQFVIGDSPLDTVAVQTDFTQSIIPGVTLTYDLGALNKRWRDIHFLSLQGVSNINVNNAYIGQVLISGNQISNVVDNTDIIFDAGGAGTLSLEDFDIRDSEIINIAGTNTILESTGIGYFKIDDTNAIIIPVGSDRQRAYTEIGETRWNTDRGYLECFDGNVYQVASGGGAVVTPKLMEEFGDLYALMLG